MKKPHHHLIKIIIFLCVISSLCLFLFLPFQNAFLTNPGLNGLIVGVLILGIAYNIRQVIQLYPEVNWIESFKMKLSDQGSTLQKEPPQAPKLLAPMATMVGKRINFTLSTAAMSALLDGIASRLDESRDTSRYMIGLLIFLGLLGTFWGLLGTVNSIGAVIGGLEINGDNSGSIFEELKQGLQAPIEDMGTAFSSSLFGLAGSLILGFLDLQANQAQNRFYNDLEEWLSTVTRLSSGSIGVEGEQSIPAYVQALLEQTAESLENLQRTLSRGEESKISLGSHLQSVSGKLETLTDHMRTQQALMQSLAEHQIEIKPILAQLANNGSNDTGLDETTRMHIRNLDVYVGRITEEMKSGRDEMSKQIRSELKLLARLIASQKNDIESQS